MSQPFTGKRAVLKRDIAIDATPETIFPLLCPVRETEWIDGWSGNAIFSRSGFAEENGVFTSKNAGADDTIWFVNSRDEAARKIEFVFFVPRLQVARLTVEVTPVAETRSRLSVEYVRTGITEAGNAHLDESVASFDAMMARWEASMNHYLETGKILKASA